MTEKYATPILIVDDNDQRAVVLEEILSNRLGTEIDGIALTYVASSNERIAQLVASEEYDETCLCVTDFAGVEPNYGSAHHVRYKFPRAQIVLHSLRAKKADALHLKRQNVIDAFVPKNPSNDDELLDVCDDALIEYFADTKLRRIREQFMQYANKDELIIEVDGRVFSPRKMFREIVQKTELGVELYDCWAI